MSDDSTETAAAAGPAAATDADSASTATKQLTSETLQPGDPISEQLIQRLSKLEKYEHKLAEVARVYRNLNTARKAVENVLKTHTPVQSIADTEELEAHLSNLNLKTQYAGEQIGALTELDKTNKARIVELESAVAGLRAVETEKLALARELEKIGKERKVVEGQLERSNQKLKIDVGRLESLVAELREKLGAAEQGSKELELLVSSADDLADKLVSLVESDPGAVEAAKADGGSGLRRLCALLVDRLGAPEGLVAAGELEAAVGASEAQLLEIAQLKDILRKEIAAGELRSEEFAKEKTELAEQLGQQKVENEKFQAKNDTLQAKNDTLQAKNDTLQAENETLRRDISDQQAKLKEQAQSEPVADSNADAADKLTAQRVNDIIVAAVSHRLVPAAAADASEKQTPLSSPKPAQQQQQQQQQQSGGKGKNKKKRKGTVSSSGAPNKAASPAAPTPAKPASEASDKQQQQADVAVSKAEIDRLVALIEEISVSAELPAVSAKEPSNESSSEELAAQLRSTIDGLQTQLKKQQQAAEDAQNASKEQIAQLQQRVAELEQELKAAVDARDALQTELSQQADQTKTAAADFERQLGEAQEAARTQAEKHRAAAETAAKELESAKELADKVPGLSEQIEQAQDAVKRLEAELGENKQKLAQAESELTATQSTCATLKQSLGDAEKERVQLASTLAKTQGANIRLETQRKELQAQLDGEKKRADKTQASLDALDAEHARVVKAAENQLRATNEAERQLSDVRSTVAALEEHVRAVDADLTNSREQFAEKSRLLAQTTAQLQEMQYAVEKERRAARISADEAAKELAGVREQLAEVRRLAKEQRADDQKEIERLRDQLGDLDQWASQASLVERLQAQHAEKEAELETLRSNLRSTEETQTALQVEVDRLRDVERDFKAAKEQLDRVTDERKLSEQRWKRLHRDLKEEVRRLHRERQTMQSTSMANGASGVAGTPLSPLPSTSPTRQSGTQQLQQLQQQQQQQQSGLVGAESSGVPSASSTSSRSNSMTLASVSSLLRAATGNAAASTASGGIAGRRGSAQPQSSSPSSSLFGRPGRFPHQLNQEAALSHAESTAALGTSQSDTAMSAGSHRYLQTADNGATAGASGVHTRTSSNAGSSSDSVFGQDDFRADNVNVEYLRNVLFRFFNDKERRPQLVPVLSMLLHCKTDDIKQIQLMLQ